MVVNFIVQTISSDASFNPQLCFWEPYGFMIQEVVNVFTYSLCIFYLCINTTFEIQ